MRKVSDFPTGFALKPAARLSLAALLEKRAGKAELFRTSGGRAAKCLITGNLGYLLFGEKVFAPSASDVGDAAEV